MILTRQQREALKRVFDRGPMYVKVDGTMSSWAHWPRATYRQFRRTVQSGINLIGGDTCVIVPWQGMWLGIERDGYTHS